MSTDKADGLARNSALVSTRELSKQYRPAGWFSRNSFAIDALVDVNFEIPRGSVTALIGESGSGKSTLARCLAMLEEPDQGEIYFDGQKITGAIARDMALLRPRVQMVFQDSAGALNPRFSAAEIIAEPLRIQKRETGEKLRERACELMKEVGLSPDWADRRPLEFSGGQRQRLGIARAIALRPAFLILDESLSGLDLSTQAQILNLLLDLQAAHSLTYLVISHDIGLVGEVADFIAVMYQGKIVEHGSAERVLNNPREGYTRQLLNSVRVVETAFRAAHAGAGR